MQIRLRRYLFQAKKKPDRSLAEFTKAKGDFCKRSPGGLGLTTLYKRGIRELLAKSIIVRYLILAANIS